jgi:hypothetical protein
LRRGQGLSEKKTIDPETEKLVREVAGFSDETYNRLANQHPFYKKILDVVKLWVKRNPVEN